MAYFPYLSPRRTPTKSWNWTRSLTRSWNWHMSETKLHTEKPFLVCSKGSFSCLHPSPALSHLSSPQLLSLTLHIVCLNLLRHPSLFLPPPPYQPTVHAFISKETAPHALSMRGTKIAMTFVQSISHPSLSPLTTSRIPIESYFHDIDEGILCIIFTLTFLGKARIWCQSLPIASTHSWDQFTTIFLF